MRGRESSVSVMSSRKLLIVAQIEFVNLVEILQEVLEVNIQFPFTRETYI